jgi:ATP/maltotriose-dependent transcriptional regulator MalT
VRRLRAIVARALDDAPSLCVLRATPDGRSIAVAVRGEGVLLLDLRVPASRRASPLTRRELEVLGVAAEGHSNAVIAARLAITGQTVKFHLANVFRKLGVANRTEATRYACTMGLLERE